MLHISGMENSCSYLCTHESASGRVFKRPIRVRDKVAVIPEAKRIFALPPSVHVSLRVWDEEFQEYVDTEIKDLPRQAKLQVISTDPDR